MCMLLTSVLVTTRVQMPGCIFSSPFCGLWCSFMKTFFFLFSLCKVKQYPCTLSMLLVERPHLLFLLQLFRSTRFAFILTVPKILMMAGHFSGNNRYNKPNATYRYTSLFPHISLYLKQTANEHSPITYRETAHGLCQFYTTWVPS